MDQFPDITFDELKEYALKQKHAIISEEAIALLKECEFACEVEIDYGKLEIGHLVGRIPMFSHEPKLNMEHVPEAEEMLKKLTKEAKMWIPKERLTGDQNVVRTSLLCAMCSHPNDDPRSLFVIVVAAVILGYYYLDDEMCGDVLFTTINDTEPVMDLWAEIITNIYHGRYASFEEIPQIPVLVEAVVRLFWLIVRKFGFIFPPEADSTHLKSAFKKSFMAMALMRIEEVGHKCSGELYRRLRAADSAATLAVELYATTLQLEQDGIGEINKKLRKHIVYKQIVEIVGEEAGISNDLVSFVKEMNGNDVYYNYVLRNVEVEGMTFQESFDKTIELVTRLRKDILLLFEQLQEEFPEDKSIVGLIVVTKQTLDANVYMGKIAPRYGGLKIREIPPPTNEAVADSKTISK